MAINDWQARHQARRTYPQHPAERRFTSLIDGLRVSIECHQRDGGRFPEGVASQAYGEIIDGVVRLLNYPTGGLDAGSLWDELSVMADTVRWDMDLSQVAWK